MILKLLSKMYSGIIHGPDRTDIDFDVDAFHADGYFVCYSEVTTKGITKSVRHEHHFAVSNQQLLHNRPHIVAARIFNRAVKDRYHPQYVLFYRAKPFELTDELRAEGFTDRDAALNIGDSVFTTAGRIDPLAFAREQKKYQEMAELYKGDDFVTEDRPKPFTFNFKGRPSRFADPDTEVPYKSIDEIKAHHEAVSLKRAQQYQSPDRFKRQFEVRNAWSQYTKESWLELRFKISDFKIKIDLKKLVVHEQKVVQLDPLIRPKRPRYQPLQVVRPWGHG
jgi:hypothetical protein